MSLNFPASPHFLTDSDTLNTAATVSTDIDNLFVRISFCVLCSLRSLSLTDSLVIAVCVCVCVFVCVCLVGRRKDVVGSR